MVFYNTLGQNDSDDYPNWINIDKPSFTSDYIPDDNFDNNLDLGDNNIPSPSSFFHSVPQFELLGDNLL